MLYTLKPGNIAAIATLHGADGEYVTCIYMNEHHIMANRGTDQREVFGELPIETAAAVALHFKKVFALRVEERGAYLRSLSCGS